MEFPKNKPSKEGINRKEQVYLEVLEKYCVISKFVGNRFEHAPKPAMDNLGGDLSSQDNVSEVPAVNMVSNEVVNPDAGRNPENANENDHVKVTGPVGPISSNNGSRRSGDGEMENKLEAAVFFPLGNKEPDRIDPPSPLHDQLQVLGEGIRPASAHCFTNPGPRQPLHNQPEMLGERVRSAENPPPRQPLHKEPEMLEERVRSASVHCSTNPPPRQPLHNQPEMLGERVRSASVQCSTNPPPMQPLHNQPEMLGERVTSAENPPPRQSLHNQPEMLGERVRSAENPPPRQPLHKEPEMLEERVRSASVHCSTNPPPRQPLHNQPEMLGDRVRSASAHCSTNPPPRQPFPTTTTFPTIIEPEVENPFKMTLQPRSMALVEPPSKLVAKAKFHPILFKDIEQQLGNLRAISSTCMSALELCTEKVVELNNGIVSLHQNRYQSGKDKQGSLDDDVNLEDNVSNIQAGLEKLRSITLLIHNSTHRIQRDIRDGLLQLNNSSGELTQATTQVGNEVSQVSAQLIQFRNRWDEQMEDIRSFVLVAEFLKQDAIERGQDVISVKKSLQELKTEEAYLHNQSLGLNESIRHICEELRTKLDGVGSAVKDLHVDMASNFAKQDERGQRIETSVGELRNEVQNQLGEQKQTVERLATKVDELRKDFSCFTRTVIEMDDAMGNAEDKLGSAGQPEEGQSSTVLPIRSAVNEGAVNIPASPGSNNIEVENLQNIGHPKLVAQNKNPRSKKKDKLEKATSSQRKPVAKGKSSANGVQTTLETRSSTAAASTSSKRVLNLDVDSPDTRPEPRPKRGRPRRLAREALSKVFSSSSESLESPSENECSSDWFKEFRVGTTKKKTKKVQAPKPEQKVLRKQVTSNVSRKNEKPTKQQPTESGIITRSKRQRMLQQEEASAAVALVGHQTLPNLCNDVHATASTVNVAAKKDIKRKKVRVRLVQ